MQQDSLCGHLLVYCRIPGIASILNLICIYHRPDDLFQNEDKSVEYSSPGNAESDYNRFNLHS